MTPNLSFKYVDISSVDNRLFKIVDHKEYLGRDAPSRARKVIRTNDVIFATTRPYLRSIAMVPAEYDDQICSTGFCVLRATKVVEPKWIFYCVQSKRFMDQILPLMRGSSYPAVTDKDVLSATIPLPPLTEQRRIVARIEELTERIDAARRLRAEAAEEAAAILPTALAEVFEEAEEKGWEVKRLSDVAHINMGQSPPGSSYNQEGIGLPLVGGASDLGEVYPSPSKWTSQPSKTSRPGDIIICVRATIGDLNWADKEYCLGRGVAGLTPKQGIEPGFLFHYLRSQHAELNARGTGSTFKQISKSTLVGLPVPLPPLDEQHRIVEYLDAVQAKVEAIRRYQAETQKEIEAMTGAVLERAFRGEL